MEISDARHALSRIVGGTVHKLSPSLLHTVSSKVMLIRFFSEGGLGGLLTHTRRGRQATFFFV